MNTSEEQLAFYSELGFAISQWAHVEFALAWITAVCFERKESQTAIDGFLAIENFRSKLRYVDTILSHRNLSDAENGDWANLYARAHALSQKRNKLVHRYVMADPKKSLDVVKCYCLAGWTKRKRPKNTQTPSASEISQVTD